MLNVVLLWMLIVFPATLAFTATTTLRMRHSRLDASSWSQVAEVIDESIMVKDTEIASPRMWLEHQQGEGDGGAYTVLRCDLSSDDDEWRVLELDFHLRRLEQSYQALTHATITKDVVLQTEQVLAKLLDKAKEVLSVGTSDQDTCCTCMVTLLWQPDDDGTGECTCAVVVKGHVYSTGVFVNPLNYEPTPITASVALGATEPNRHNHSPRAKLSSWCRTRRPLEDRFKPNNDTVDEVLLVHGSTLLEGLTSNLFVLWSNQTLTTPADGVLEGCARNLVIQQAQRLGWTVQCGPVPIESLEDAEEVFLTSAIRLIIPVGKIVTVGQDGTIDEVLWSTPQVPHKWREIFEAIWHGNTKSQRLNK